MLRLLFCSAALLPVAIIPWMTSEARGVAETEVTDLTYAEAIVDPSLATLADCEIEDVPVFFHDDLVSSHSAAFIHDSIDVAESCGDVDITIIPVLPDYADSADIAESVERTSELREIVRLSSSDVDVSVAKSPMEVETPTLYINGRAAILRIDPTE